MKPEAVKKILMETAVSGARQIGKAFDSANDDWVPTLMHLDGEGKFRIAAVMIDDHDEAAEAVAYTLRQSRSVAAVLIMSAWTLTRPTLTGERPRDAADRVEQLVFTFADGDSTSCVGYLIFRDGENPPVLSEEPFMSGTGLDVAGRFSDALRVGLVAAAS